MKKPKPRTPKPITCEDIESERRAILRRARQHIASAKKLLDAIDLCLAESGAFPIYLADFQNHARVLDILAGKHVALTDLLARVSR